MQWVGKGTREGSRCLTRAVRVALSDQRLRTATAAISACVLPLSLSFHSFVFRLHKSYSFLSLSAFSLPLVHLNLQTISDSTIKPPHYHPQAASLFPPLPPLPSLFLPLPGVTALADMAAGARLAALLGMAVLLSLHAGPASAQLPAKGKTKKFTTCIDESLTSKWNAREGREGVRGLKAANPQGMHRWKDRAFVMSFQAQPCRLTVCVAAGARIAWKSTVPSALSKPTAAAAALPLLPNAFIALRLSS